MSRDFSSRVRRAAKKASNNGKCWWIERYILNAYLWRGPDKLGHTLKQFKEHYNDKEKENDLQRIDELCESS